MVGGSGTVIQAITRKSPYHRGNGNDAVLGERQRGVGLCTRVVRREDDVSIRPKDRLVKLLQPVSLILAQTSRCIRIALRSTQEGVWVPLAEVGVCDDPIYLPIEPIALTENFLRNRAPEGRRDGAGCVGGNISGPDPIGAHKIIPINSRGPGKNTVKVFRVLRSNGNTFSPSGRTPVIIRMMWCCAVVTRGDLFTDSYRHVHRTIRKIDEGFGFRW